MVTTRTKQKPMRILLASLALCATCLEGSAQSYQIHYQWLNIPCSTNIHCNEGCSACALPESSSGIFFGTNMGWVGITVCPIPVATGDNALYSNAWPTIPSNSHFGMLSGIASIPLQVDSIIITHRREVTGPQRMRISYTNNAEAPPVEVADVEVPQDWDHTVLTDLGCMPIINDMAYGMFQLRVQPYQGQGGNWILDEVRVVGTLCSELSTGIEATFERNPVSRTETWYDVLGRPVRDGQAAPGVYHGGGKRVVRLH
jgi:hypothetical protein